MIRLKPTIKEKINGWLAAFNYRNSVLFDGWLWLFCTHTHPEEIIRKSMIFVRYSNIAGDYLEFGCYQGHSLAAAFHFARKWYLDAMRFFAFDSFQGLPSLSPTDTRDSRFGKGDFACDLEDFHRRLRRKRVDLSKVTTIPGFYQDTLNDETKKRLDTKKAAIIYVDCDLYESTVPVLNFITDYLQDGTVLIFDDWFLFRGQPDRGEQKAFNEWLRGNPSVGVVEFHKFGWGGNSFIIHLNKNESQNENLPNDSF